MKGLIISILINQLSCVFKTLLYQLTIYLFKCPFDNILRVFLYFIYQVLELDLFVMLLDHTETLFYTIGHRGIGRCKGHLEPLLLQYLSGSL